MKFFQRQHSIVLVILALTLVACTKTPEQHYQNAQELMNKADYKAAIIELKTVLQTQPNNAEARKLLGQAYIQIRAYASAENELSKARLLGVADEETLPSLILAYTRMGEPEKALTVAIPDSGMSPKALTAAYVARAEAQIALGNLKEAEQALNTAAHTGPNQAGMLLARAKLAILNKQMDQASQWVEAALKSDSNFIEALYMKAALLETAQKPAEAANIYKKIIKADSSEFNAYLGLATQQMRQGDIKGADQSVQAAEKLAPRVPLVKYTRGILELQRGNLGPASNNLLGVLQVMPDHIPSMLAYALVSFGQGNYLQSIKYANKIVELGSGNIVATKLLVSSQLKIGDSKSAIQAVNKYFAKYPDEPQLLALGGEAYAAAGDHLKAQSYFDRAVKAAPSNSLIKARQANYQLALGNRSQALVDLEAAASMTSKPGEADVNLIMLYMKGNEFDSALRAVDKLEKKLPDSPITYNFRAAALLGKHDRAGARKALEHALVLDPNFFPAAANLAGMDIQEGKPEVAKQRYLAMLEKDKKNISIMVALADLAARQKNDKNYADWLQKAVKANPRALEASSKLVQYYLKTKQNSKALSLAQDALNADRESIPAMNLLGATQLATGDNEAAVSTFTQITEKTPRSAVAFLNLALAQSAANQSATARASLNTALQLNPQSDEARDMLMRMELANKNPEAAMLMARTIQTQQPKSPVGFDREGDIQVFQKQYAEAAKAYEQAIANGGGPAELIKQHRALVAAGQNQMAEQKLLNWLKSKPSDIGIRTYLAEVYLQTQRKPEAIEQYQLILQTQPTNLVALNNLATLYQQGKDNRALATAQKAYNVAPQHPGVQDTLGWILVEQGQLVQGLSLLNRAALNAPNVASIRYHLGAALVGTGKKAEAKKELALSLKMGQKFPESGKAQTLLNSLE